MHRFQNEQHARKEGIAIAIAVFSVVIIAATFAAVRASTIRYFIVPENHLGVAVEQSLIIFKDTTFIPPGKYEEKKGRTLYALPLGDQKITFEVRVPYGLRTKAADALESFRKLTGSDRSGMLGKAEHALGAKAYVASGTVSLDLNEKALRGLVEDNGGKVDYATLLEKPIRKSVEASVRNLEGNDDFEDTVLVRLNKELQPYFISANRISLSKLEELEGRDAQELTVGKLSAKVLTPAPLSEVKWALFWPAFALAIVLIFVFGGLFVVAPDAFVALLTFEVLFH